MHIDARQLDNNSVIEGDICIIGSGAAGITTAIEWNNTPYKVILLEGGGFEYDEKVQELYKGKITGHPYYPMESSRLHYFGGTTMHWGGMCSPFDPIDFEERNWVDHGKWPIPKEEILSYYPRAHPILDLGPCEWDLSYWQNVFPTFQPMPLDKEVIWSKMWQFSAPTRFGTKYKDTIVNSKNIHLYTYANVVDIVANENVNNITEVTVKNYAGKEHKVKARHFIIACCAIQSARLLLAANRQAKNGLGNDNDLVGRFFMEHIEIKSGELWLNSSDGLDLYMLGKSARAELAITAKKQRELEILNATISFWPLDIANKMKPSVVTWQENDPRKSLTTWEKYYGAAQKKSLLNRLIDSKKHHAYGLYTRSEQAPNPNSRVMLSTERDSLGMPRANLYWDMLPIDKKTIRKTNELLGQQVGAAGYGRVKLADYLNDENDTSMPSYTSGGWHHMGTCRMHESPKLGVVDADCKVHGINNLFVSGAATFTTGGAVNPTLTVVAIALRVSDHVKKLMTSSPKGF